MIHLNKSFFYFHDNTHLIVGIRVRRITRIRQGLFSFTNLECPIFYGRMIKPHFEDLVKKDHKKFMLWQNKCLSYGVKFISIENVLQSTLIYLLSIMNPPKRPLNSCIKYLQDLFGLKQRERKECTQQLKRPVFSKETRWSKFRSLQDISKALFAKLQ